MNPLLYTDKELIVIMANHVGNMLASKDTSTVPVAVRPQAVYSLCKEWYTASKDVLLNPNAVTDAPHQDILASLREEFGVHAAAWFVRQMNGIPVILPGVSPH